MGAAHRRRSINHDGLRGPAHGATAPAAAAGAPFAPGVVPAAAGAVQLRQAVDHVQQGRSGAECPPVAELQVGPEEAPVDPLQLGVRHDLRRRLARPRARGLHDPVLRVSRVPPRGATDGSTVRARGKERRSIENGRAL